MIFNTIDRAISARFLAAFMAFTMVTSFVPLTASAQALVGQETPFVSIDNVVIDQCGLQDVEVTGTVAFQVPTSADSLVLKLDGAIVMDDEDIDDDPDGVLEPWSHTLIGLTPGAYDLEIIMYDDDVNNTNPKVSTTTSFEIEECPPTESSETIVVTELDLNDWVVSGTGGGEVDFIKTGDAPLGIGTLNLLSDSQNSARAGVSLEVDSPLSDITELAYQTKQHTANFAGGDASYRLAIDVDGNLGTTNDTATLIFEPYWQNGGLGDPDPVVTGVWQTWDVDEGLFWASIPGANQANIPSLTNGAGGPPFYTIADVLDVYPDTQVFGISVAIGSYNPSYDIEVDEVVFGSFDEGANNTHTITYDFEPVDPWCSFEGEVIEYSDPAFKNSGAEVDADRRDVTGVENGPADYANFGGKEPTWSTDDFFSLGIGGYLIYEFTASVAFDQPGDDIAIYEITGGPENQQSDEKVGVYVSHNGTNWVSMGTSTGDVALDISTTGLPFVKYVKLVDDSEGIQGSGGDGYDVDAIVILEGSCGDEPEPEIPQCVEGSTIFMIGQDEIDQLNDHPSDEFSWNGAFGDFSLPTANPFIVGVSSDKLFPWNSNFGAGEATDFDVDFSYAGPDIENAKLVVAWSPGNSDNETKEIRLDGDLVGTSSYHGTAVAGWFNQMKVFDDEFTFPLTAGDHTLNFKHTEGDGTLWDYVELIQQCEFDEEGELTVVKVIEGGNATTSDFTLKVDDTEVTSGEANTFAAGEYVVTEEGDMENYVASFSGACDENGNVTVKDEGEHICTITNTYTPPLACEPGVNLFANRNGSFETPEVEHNAKWDIFADGTSGLDWVVAWFIDNFGGNDPDVDPQLELHRGVNGWASSDGEQHAELDSDWGGPDSDQTGEEASVMISQEVPTIPGEEYTLTWDFSPRPDTFQSDNDLLVLVDGGEVANNSAAGGGNVNWTTHSYSFEATGNTTEIAFADDGNPNSQGTFLDNVSLVCEPAAEYGPYCGDGDVNQDWEMCEPGDDNCTNYCTLANQCTDLQLVKIDLDNTAEQSESFDGMVYLGSDSNPIPNNTWFLFDEAGDATAESIAVATEGLGIERDLVDGTLNFAFVGGNDSKDLDFVSGTVETLGIDLGTVNRLLVPGFGLENSAPAFIDIFDVVGDTMINFDMRADTGDDGVSVEVESSEEPYDCPECTATVEARVVLRDGTQIINTGEGNLEPTVILGDYSEYDFGEWFPIYDGTDFIDDATHVQSFSDPETREGLFVSREKNGTVRVALYGYHNPGGDTNNESLQATLEFRDALIEYDSAKQINGQYAIENHAANWDEVLNNDDFDRITEKGDLTGVDFDFWVDTKADGFKVEVDRNTIDSCDEDDEDTYLIDGYKWNDEDGDGEINGDESGIEGWTIYATDGDVTLSTTTNENGYYSFEVPEGEWEVYEEEVEGWTQTYPGDYGSCEFIFPEEEPNYYFNLFKNLIPQFILGDEQNDEYENDCNFGNQQDGDGGGDNDFVLSITFTGEGDGDIFDDLENLICFFEGEVKMCTGTYASGTVVALTVDPDEGSNFDNSWTVGSGTCTASTTPCDVTMDQDVDLTAHFDLDDDPTPTITTTSGGGGGTRISLTNRTSNDLQPVGQVLGEQVSVVPVGAPNAGAGGGAKQFGAPAMLAAAILAAFVTLRKRVTHA